MPGPERLSKYIVIFQQVKVISGITVDAVGASDYFYVAFTTVLIVSWEIKQIGRN